MEFLSHLREPSNSVNFFHVFLRGELILSLLNPIVQTHLSEINQSIMEFSFSKPTETYRIRVTVAIYRNNILSYKNEVIIPSEYLRRTEARGHIQKEISERLVHSNFFRSPRPDYDLVRYTEEATCNTFLRYRILSLKSGEGLIRERI